MKKNVLVNLAKLALGVTIVALIFWRMDFASAVDALGNSDFAWVGLGVAVAFAATCVEGFRLFLLMNGAMGLFEAVRVAFFVIMFSTVVPSGVGGEAYKVYRIKKLTGSWAHGASVLLADRIAGLCALVTLVLVGGAYTGILGMVAQGAGAKLSGLMQNLPLVLGVLIALLAAGWLAFTHLGKLREFMRECCLKIRELPARVMLLLYFVAGFNLVVRASSLYCFVRALGEGLPLSTVVMVSALTYFTDLLPISTASLGVWEGVVSYLLFSFGLSKGTALATAILGRTAFILQLLAGVGMWFWEKPSLPKDTPKP